MDIKEYCKMQVERAKEHAAKHIIITVGIKRFIVIFLSPFRDSTFSTLPWQLILPSCTNSTFGLPNQPAHDRIIL
jgi:hypothetical protein